MMKRAVFTTLVVVFCVAMATPCYGEIIEGDRGRLDTLSYNLGANIGSGIKQQMREVDLDAERIATGIVEACAGKATMQLEEVLILLKSYFGATLNERYAEYKEVLKKRPKAKFNAFRSKGERSGISYAVGVDFGTNISKSKLPIQYYWLVEGFKDAWAGKTKFTEEQLMSYLNHYFTVVVPAENAKRSAMWLETVKNSAGVKATESGLLYKVVAEGEKSKAATSDDDVVKVHYVGRLQDGTVFDASRFEHWTKERQARVREQQPNLFDKQGRYIQNKPVEFPLNRVIKGWTEGMKLIGPGGKIVLYIPAELAYGDRGAGNEIGPNEALEFEVELIDVTPAKK